MQLKSVLPLVSLLFLFSCNGKKESVAEQETGQEQPPTSESSLPLHLLNLPAGFKIDTYAEGLDGARSMCSGTQQDIKSPIYELYIAL